MCVSLKTVFRRQSHSLVGMNIGCSRHRGARSFYNQFATNNEAGWRRRSKLMAKRVKEINVLSFYGPFIFSSFMFLIIKGSRY
jgi:hypothetical protein